MKRLFIVACLIFGGSSIVYAEKISNYKINVTVEQSGELSIVEFIEYDFEKQSKHGMFRDIPFTIKREGRIKDLGLYDFSVQLDDGSAEWKQSTLKSSHAGNLIRLKIGSENSYVTDKHLYKISYRVKKGVLPAAHDEQNDAIRWNIIGTGWQIPIANVEANFFLPSSLSQKNIALSSYSGYYGTKSSMETSMWINEKHLQVIIANLKPYEGATVEMAYPANILDQNGLRNVEASFLDQFFDYWHWGVFVGFLLYFRKIFKKYTGFVDERSVAVQYEAPKGLSVLQSGLILDKFSDNEDYAAAVLELGYLGYLRIEQKDKKLDPVIKRTNKKAEGLTVDQNYLLDNTLFDDTKNFVMSGGSESKAKALQNKFKHINKNLYTWSVTNGYMMEDPKKVRKIFLWKSILYLLPVIGLVIYILYSKFGEVVLLLLIFPVVFGTLGINMMMSSKKWLAKLRGLIFTGVGMLPIFLIRIEGINLKELIVGPMGMLILLALILAFTYKKIGRFTQKGAYASKHLQGLKEFIKRVKQDEIKRRLEIDPLYLEKMLPYAVLFKETDHWLSFYDILSIKTPLWYHGNVSNIGGFSSSVNSASTPPSQGSSGGGGFSGGGGSSGGGGGGGGGGSW